ncbi:hypothetical protein BV22DRAFT_1128462 [Leucogyrophana mollusca]|uniref:Uncharacterized protein n=1 Tax=Leucogyrophana mollusca TaxID=85980 RepID=A0ACB8BND7_9AGAM|nr:hypothetical protein BV22DRAFT_1128462 [Leucogyrophana mollusca]
MRRSNGRSRRPKRIGPLRYNSDNPFSPSPEEYTAFHPPPQNTLRYRTLLGLILLTIVLYVSLLILESRSTGTTVDQQPSKTSSFTNKRGTVNGSGGRAVYANSTRVDRSILHILHDLHEDDHSSNSTRPLPEVHPSPAKPWPPLVTRIPEELSTPTQLSPEDLARLDKEDCGHYPCRFLFPLRIAEQESKARIHITQIAKLARGLNRTLVLPNVGKSRIGACFRWPFEAYYDVESFIESTSDETELHVMDMAGFRQWVTRRSVAPQSQTVSLKTRIGKTREPEPVAGKRLAPEAEFTVNIDMDPQPAFCMPTKFPHLRPSGHAPLSVSVEPGRLKNSMTGQHIIDVLSLLEEKGTWTSDGEDFQYVGGDGYGGSVPLSSDVLVLNWDLRYPIFPIRNVNLRYAPELTALAGRLAESVGPYLAIHWRMESVALENLAWCAASLIETLRDVLESETNGDIRIVWLATDYPYSVAVRDAPDVETSSQEGVRRSGTFRKVEPEHTDAMNTLMTAFHSGGSLDAWKITDLSENLDEFEDREVRTDDGLLRDRGVRAILDKLVAIQAPIFVSGTSQCSRVSSFSKQIIDARTNTHTGTTIPRDIRNVVELFGEWGRS